MRPDLSYQRTLFDTTKIKPDPQHAKYRGRSGAFVDNMTLPVHRWFRYSAGFSAEWVRHVVRQIGTAKRQLSVLDPFAGVGTTLLACDAEQTKSLGFETHPFVYRIARAKLRAIHLNVPKAMSYFHAFLADASKTGSQAPDSLPPLLQKCYTGEALSKLAALKGTYLSRYLAETPESELVWLVITAILRSCSEAGTAQWQYVLPKKKKGNVLDPFVAFRAKADEVLTDILCAQENGWAQMSRLLLTDARNPSGAEDTPVDAVITSPPYPNNYDYADATRLEMTFWGEVASWGDLHEAVRRHLIRSCSQHSAADRLNLDRLLQDDVLAPIHDELSRACQQLADIRLTKGGKKTYHTMAAAYFADLGHVFRALRRLCREGSKLCFVIGDSAPYGVYLKVDEWLGKLAVAAGFKEFRFEKIRDRNTKWKNRKHRVPLKEGRLWIEG